MKASHAAASVVAIASLLCSGCMPWPHRHYFAPEAEGVVLREGVPVVGAKVSLTAALVKEKSEGVTDNTGRFHLAALKEWEFIAYLLGDPLYGYTLHIQAQDADYEGYSEYLVGYAPSRVGFTCDLSHPAGFFINKRPLYCVQQEK